MASETNDNQPEKKEEEEEELDLNKGRFSSTPGDEGCVKVLICCLLCVAALQHAGKHMEDSIAASYTALLLGCLCQGSQVRDPTHTHTHTQGSRGCGCSRSRARLSPSDQRDYCETTSAQRGFLHHDGDAEEVLEFHEPHRECDNKRRV